MGRIDTYTSFMEQIARDDTHGYSQLNRYGQPDYDCSWLTIDALMHADFDMTSATFTGNMDKVLERNGFQNVISAVNVATGAGLQRGDILRKPGHVAVYCGNGMEVEAAADEYGGIEGRNPGDQTGYEILIQFYNPNWQTVLRFQEEDKIMIELRTLQAGMTGDDVKLMQRLLRSRSFKDNKRHALKLDGIFAQSTMEALLKFQKSHKLVQDCICGEKTWNKLLFL